MPLGFGHLVFCWICAKIYQKIKKIRLSKEVWGLLLFGSILPDIDFLVEWTTTYSIHRGVTHSLFFAVVIGLVVFGISTLMKKRDRFKHWIPFAMGSAIAIGIGTHLFLDFFYQCGVPLFWPYAGRFGIAILGNSFSSDYFAAVFDIGLGVAWMGYLFIRGRLRF